MQRTAPRRQGRRIPSAKPPALSLREDFIPGSRSPLKVDREAGIIYRAKILGWESSNGRRYDPQAAKRAKGLYEGKKAYCNHPKRPTESRDVDDALGVWRNVQWEPDGLYSDFHYVKSHPMAERVCEDAERGMGVFGFSHNADGKGDHEGGVLVISEITEVRSVDLVTDPATVKNLWESTVAQTTLRQLVEQSAVKPSVKNAILEDGADMLDMPMDEPAADMGAGDWKADLVAAIGKLVQSESDEDHNMAKKIMGMLKPESAAPAEAPMEEADGEAEEDEEEEKEVEEGSDFLRGKNKYGKKGQMGQIMKKDPEGHGMGHNEAKTPKQSAPGVTVLTEARAKTFCKLAGVTPDAELLEAMIGLDEDKGLKLLEWSKAKLVPARLASGPRSQGPGANGVTKNQPEVKDGKSFAAAVSKRF